MIEQVRGVWGEVVGVSVEECPRLREVQGGAGGGLLRVVLLEVVCMRWIERNIWVDRV